MKELLTKVIDHLCCSHDWQIFNKTTVYSDIGSSYIVYALVCKKCGKIKKLKIK